MLRRIDVLSEIIYWKAHWRLRRNWVKKAEKTQAFLHS